MSSTIESDTPPGYDLAVEGWKGMLGRVAQGERIRVEWCGTVEQDLQQMFVESFLGANSVKTLSLSAQGFTHGPLFPAGNLPESFLPNLSTIEADTMDSLIKLVPGRPVHTVTLDEFISWDSIDPVVEALKQSTSNIENLQIVINGAPDQDQIVKTLEIIVAEFKDLVTLQWTCRPHDIRDPYFVEGILGKIASKEGLANLKHLKALKLRLFAGVVGPGPQKPVLVKAMGDIAPKLPVLERIWIQGSEWEKDPTKTDVSEWKEVPREQSSSEHQRPPSVAEGPLNFGEWREEPKEPPSGHRPRSVAEKPLDFGYSLPVIVTQWTPHPGVLQWVTGRMAGTIERGMTLMGTGRRLRPIVHALKKLLHI